LRECSYSYKRRGNKTMHLFIFSESRAEAEGRDGPWPIGDANVTCAACCAVGLLTNYIAP
jgi:hypothetical protein